MSLYNKNYFLLLNNKFFFNENNIHTIDLNNINLNNIPNKNSILFLGSHSKSIDNYNNILNNFLNIIKNKEYKYIIITGKSDGILDSNLQIPNNIVNIYSNNINYNHEKIKYLPIGRDFRSLTSFNISYKYSNKDILCYCNFSLNTHNDRKLIYDKIKDKTFITIENMGEFLKYDISRNMFFQKLGQSKFVICPRGNALDTFRFFDTIYSGAIPIVIKENFHNSFFFKNIPILYLNNVDEFDNLTEDFLNKKYDELIGKKKDYYENLDFKLFINNIKNKIEK